MAVKKAKRIPAIAEMIATSSTKVISVSSP
jgi:hypothetical protein